MDTNQIEQANFLKKTDELKSTYLVCIEFHPLDDNPMSTNTFGALLSLVGKCGHKEPQQNIHQLDQLEKEGMELVK